MPRLLVLASVSGLLVSGCSTGLMVAGGGMIVAGGMTLAQPDQHCASSGSAGDDAVCGILVEPIDTIGNAAKDTAGVLLIAAGAAALIGGIVMREHEKADEAAAQVPPPARTFAFAPAGPPAMMGAPPPEIVVATPATLALRAHEQNRLAMQASTLALRGDCAGVAPTMDRLAQLDAALYRTLLVRDVEVARCVTLAAAPAAP